MKWGIWAEIDKQWYGTAYVGIFGLSFEEAQRKYTSTKDSYFETSNINEAFKYLEECYRKKDIRASPIVKERE